MTIYTQINQFFTPKWRLWLGILASALLLLALSQPIFKDFFTRPNSLMYSYGSDALVLHFNTAFHTRYDKDSHLRNMNYPDGEYIYLTDAQGAISNTLQWINRHIIDISGQTVGIVNGLNLYLLFLAVVVVFLLLRALRAHLFTAILFAPMIVLLSPHIFRMGGHFGLAYPFLIPLAMLWFLRKYRLGYLEKRDALMLGVSVFFTFNNPYMGFNINFFLFLAGILLFAAQGFKWKNWKQPAIISGMGLFALGLAYLNFALFDPVQDRINPQWGFFVFHATVEGLFYPPHSILHDWLAKAKVATTEVDFEALLNVGLVTTMVLAVMLLMTIAKPFFRHKKPSLQQLAPEQRILLGAALLLFLVAANTSLINISPEWLEQNMGWLLMFKASGRLGWPLYFALTVTAVIFIDKVFRLISPWYLAALFSLLLAALWNAELNQYIRPHFAKSVYDNVYDREHEQEMLEILSQNKVDLSQFQAILSVPETITWSDKTLSHINFRTQLHSLRLSLATGFPLVNSMLSRIGLQHTLERVQMLSNPLVERTLLQKFPNQKDLLLLAGSDAIPELKNGEQFLLSIAQPLAQTKNFSLYRLRLSDLQHNTVLQGAKAAFQTGAFTPPSLHLSYDETPSSQAFYGKGSHQTRALEEEIVAFKSPFERDTQMVFSAWTYVDPGQWNAGFWLLSVRDPSGAELHNIKLETRRSNDVQDSWMRAEATMPLPRGAQLLISSYGQKPMLIDEVMLWPAGVSPIVNDPNAEAFLFENFKVRK